MINISGAYLIGCVLVTILEHPSWPALVRPFACVGILGGWTTMSTFAVGADRLASRGHPWLTVAYLASTLLGGGLATAAGISIGRRAGRSGAVSGAGL